MQKDYQQLKRSVLRISTRIFDPLGFISPVTITAKMLFQKLCMQKIGWDNPLSGDTLAKWEKFIAELPMLIKICVPRCYVVPEQIPTYHQIHGKEELKKSPPLITYALANPSVCSNEATVNLESVIEINRYGSKLKLLRVTATVLVATEIFTRVRKDKPRRVIAQDMVRAERLWMKTVQYQSFQEEY